MHTKEHVEGCGSLRAHSGVGVSRDDCCIPCRWLAHLPEPLKRAGAPYSQCCLFWHPSDEDAGWEHASMWKQWKASNFGRSVRLAVRVRLVS